MISVIVPVQDETREAVAALERWAPAGEAELLIAHDTAGSRGASLARAAARSRGEILFFVHADSRPPNDALPVIRRTIAGGAAAGAFSLGYEREDSRMRRTCTAPNPSRPTGGSSSYRTTGPNTR